MEVFEIGEMRENSAHSLLCNSVHLLEVLGGESIEAGIPSPFNSEGVRVSPIAIKED